MTYFLDTNIFIRVLAPEDKKSFEECKKVLEMVKEGEIEAVTAGVVLMEIVWVLGRLYKLEREEVYEKVKAIICLNNLMVLDKYDWMTATESFGKYKIKLADAVIASVPEVKRKEWVVLSYDSDFGKLPVVWKRPGEIT